jgi:hypothetical protein
MLVQEDSRQLAVFDTFMSYSGSNLDEHEMDVKLFADVLVGNAQMVKNIGNIVFGPNIKVGVKIRAIKENGVQAEILIYLSQAQNVMHSLYVSDTMTMIREFVEMAGLLGIPGVSIYKIIKFLNGRKIDNADVGKDITTITLSDGTHETISTKLYYVLINIGIVNGIKKLIAPLNRKGIDKFKLLDVQPDTPPIETTVIDKEDLPAFKAYIKNQIESTQEYVIVCTLDRPSYQGKASGWKLIRQGHPDITVTVKDKEFLYNVEKNIIKVDAESFFRVWYTEIRKENRSGDVVLKYEAMRIIPLP